MQGMSLTQALTLAGLLIDFELESPAVQPPPVAWASELKAARQAINEALNRPEAGEFFLSAPGPRRPGRRSNQVLA